MMGWMGIRELGIGVKEGGRRAIDPIHKMQSMQSIQYHWPTVADVRIFSAHS